MDTNLSLAEWAQRMADTVQHRTRAQDQRHQAGLLNQAQAENLWVKGMDQVVQTLDVLVRALKHTGHFPELTLVSYAQSPQGTTTYMRRGTLLSLKGLEQKSPVIKFEIDPDPPFRPDLLAPTIRVVSKPETGHATAAGQEYFCFGVSLQGAIIWHLLSSAEGMPLEGSVEEMLRSFLASLLLTE